MILFDNLNQMALDQRHAPFNPAYLQRIAQVLSNTLNDHPRTTVIRVDPRLPEYRDMGDSIVCSPDLSQGLMSRFIESLNAKITAYLRRKAREDKRVHRCSLRYLWVREQPDLSGKKHYHTALLLSTDSFNALGSYDEKGTGLASLIQEAWLSALGMREWPEYRELVHFPDNPLYFLDLNRGGFRETLDDLTRRLSYMAKQRTKIYNSKERSFGCSQS